MSSRLIYLYVTPFFPSDRRWQGGFCYDAVCALQKVGDYDVKVLLAGGTADYEYHGINVHSVRRMKLPCDCAPFLFTRVNGWLFKRKLAQLGIKPKDVAVCHSNMLPEYSYAIKRANPRAKVCWQTHWMGAPFTLSVYRLGIVKGLTDILYLYWRRMLESMDVVVLLSKLHGRQFGKAYPDGPLGREIDMREQTLFRKYRSIAPKKTVVFYNGINTDVFRAETNGRAHDGFVIGCVANFGLTKGQMTLLKAVRRIVAAKTIQGLRVKLVGSGPELDRCRAYVRENGLGDAVEFIQECDHLKLPEFYRSLDLFVLPTWQEGFCCTLVESVGCGVPAITTNRVSFVEVIPDEDRHLWLVDPLDDEQLARKIAEYHEKRPAFRFNRSMDIKDLWCEFLRKI